MKIESFAPGKIILSGEYAVVFGYPGIAVPSPIGMKVTFEEKPDAKKIDVKWKGMPKEWKKYLESIIEHCRNLGCDMKGTLTIDNALPLGKGMGSSTSLVIGVCRCLLGENCRDTALAVEDSVNPGHSGVDFNVIWMNSPILFMKGQEVEKIDSDLKPLKGAYLIDTGEPNETTPELVSWIGERKKELTPVFKRITDCTNRIASGNDWNDIISEHNKAQIELGVIPENVQEFIELIENKGGAAKVIGAGCRTGGAGMILAIGISESVLKDQQFPYFPL